MHHIYSAATCWKKNREVYQQNDYVPPSQEIQMNDVYNEISNERNSKGVQQMTLTTEQRHSSMSSNISCSVYNHLHESTVDNRENHYEHVHLTKTEDPALGHFNGTLDDVPNADKDSDEGVVDDNDFLFQKENLPIPESDGLKTNDNYFVLEKSLFT
ncbi:uncharacterized protein LOC134229162 [Saccostrea cucullata]|uniref:uncharacterized protein LOC134229162 n=1 Tax=Saccostrea cuccullata TaxID=36930 RepID=UPI002ED3E32C